MPARRMDDGYRADDATDAGGRFAYEGLDRVMHERARLGILASLAANAEGLAFNDLKRLCGLTDGNLSRHLAVLAQAGFVEDRRDERSGRSHTTYWLTPGGRRRFASYLSVLEQVVTDARADAGSRPTLRGAGGSWSPA